MLSPKTFCCVALAVPPFFLLTALLFTILEIAPLYTSSYSTPIYFGSTPYGTINAIGSSTFCNFDRSTCCSTAHPVQFPRTIQEVQKIVVSAKEGRVVVRVVGGGHSMFELVCDDDRNQKSNTSSNGELLLLVSLDRMNHLVSVDTETNRAVVEGGMRLRDVNAALHYAGVALHNLGMIDEQSIAGLIATGTHGTGPSLMSVSNQVVSLTLVTGTGDVLELSEESNSQLFSFAKIHFGLLGIVVRVGLQGRRSFVLSREHKFVDQSLAIPNFLQDSKKHRNYQMWWIPDTTVFWQNIMDEVTDEGEVWDNLLVPKWSAQGIMSSTNFYTPFAKMLRKAKQDVLYFMITRAAAAFPSIGPKFLKLLPVVEVDQFILGHSYDMLTHPGINYHTVRYSEMEYFMPIEEFEAAIWSYLKFHDENRESCPMNAIHPVRTVKGDVLPLSPQKDRTASIAMSFVLVNRPDIWEHCSRKMEAIFLRHGGRPHWGKVHYLTANQVEQLYGVETIQQFRRIVAELDPARIFRTKKLSTLFGLN